jgi:putative oxidoreductase
MRMFNKIIQTDHAKTTLLIRLMVGLIFLSEGIQKFLFPAQRGAGRFEDIGLPAPEFFGYFVGAFEALCGFLIIIGFATRLAAIPLIIIMSTAILTTKVGTFADQGFWEGMHASRNDWSMLMGSLFLLIAGGGKWSIDRDLQKRRLRGRGGSYRYWQ